jgi:hypothetical protein
MPVTLNDQEVAALKAEREQWQRDRQIAEFANAIWNDPALSDEAKALAKKKFPTTPIPDYDLRQELRSELKKDRDERTREKEEAEKKKASDFYADQKTQVQKRHGFTDDAMERMEAEMRDKRVYDYEVMATHFASREPKPIETTNSGHFWNHHKSDEFKKIVSDPEDYAFNEIVGAIQRDEANSRNNKY